MSNVTKPVDYFDNNGRATTKELAVYVEARAYWNLGRELSAMRKQRDELLEALKAFEDCEFAMRNKRAYTKLCAAIAKVRS